MKWYYSANREKLGPVDEVAFELLVAGGVITDETLVWHKGMPEWRPHGEVKAVPTAPMASAPPPPPAPDKPAGNEPPGVTCSSCGAFLLMDKTVRFGDDYVCMECRENHVRKQDEERQSEEEDTPDETVRKSGLKYERRIRTAAAMYFFVAGILSLLALISGLSGDFGGLLVVGVLSALVFIAARALYGMRARAKLAAGSVSGLSLIVFPFGTLIHLYILYLVFCPTGRRLLNENHRAVITRTPHIKCPISWIGATLLSIGFIIAFIVFVALLKNN